MHVYNNNNLILPILFKRTHESCLVLWRLESTVAKLGAGINELEINLFKSLLLGVSQKAFPQS